MIYVLSPYTSHLTTPLERARQETRRARAAAVYAGILTELGLPCWSPIVHGHAIKRARPGMPGYFEYWRESCFEQIRRSDYLHLLALPEWELSIGIAAELDFARTIGKYWLQVEPQQEILDCLSG